MKELLPSDFSGSAVELARSLIGAKIVFNGCEAMIVETEAYLDDQASHGHVITPKSQIMQDTFGHIYVYFIYGMYFCLNITTNKEAVGAVLIRAAEPLSGLDSMKTRRNKEKLKDLCSGPSKLCQAFGISKENLNGSQVGEKLRVYQYKTFADSEITQTTRVGISKAKDLPWRFYVTESKHVSRR